MIDYELLCQTIEDWRAGRRPSIDLSASPVGAGVAEEYEVDAEQGYEEQQYADPNESYDAYGQQQDAYGYEYDGSPASVPGSGTSPMEVTDVEYDQ
jgi:hypothetical protein